MSEIKIVLKEGQITINAGTGKVVIPVKNSADKPRTTVLKLNQGKKYPYWLFTYGMSNNFDSITEVADTMSNGTVGILTPAQAEQLIYVLLLVFIHEDSMHQSILERVTDSFFPKNVEVDVKDLSGYTGYSVGMLKPEYHKCLKND